MKKIFVAFYVAAAFSGLALAAPDQGQADELAIRAAIAKAYPQVDIKKVTKSGYGGLYEVFLGGEIVYADAKGEFMVAGGQLLSLKEQKNVTEERMAELTRIDFAALPFDKAIKTVKGSGAHRIAVFSDPDCPFCRKFEQEISPDLKDVTIYTFLYPLNIHPGAEKKARQIWCSADRAKAWDEVMVKSSEAQGSGVCENPVADLSALGAKFNVTGTPTIFFEDGSRISGALPANHMNEKIKSINAH